MSRGGRRAGGGAAPAALLLALLAAACGSGAAAERAARTHAVSIESFLYAPAALEVAVGDTVAWVNRDLVPHTATAQGWDSGSLAAGDTGRVVMRRAGEYDYLCAFHPGMKARLVVR